MTHGLLPLTTFGSCWFDRAPTTFPGGPRLKAGQFTAQTLIPPVHPQGSPLDTPSFRQTRGATTIADHLSQGRLALECLRHLQQGVGIQRQFDRETTWLAANRHKYSGQWIALNGDRLLAVGASAREVFSEVADYDPPPLVIRIVEQELPFAGW